MIVCIALTALAVAVPPIAAWELWQRHRATRRCAEHGVVVALSREMLSDQPADAHERVWARVCAGGTRPIAVTVPRSRRTS